MNCNSFLYLRYKRTVYNDAYADLFKKKSEGINDKTLFAPYLK